MGLVDYSDSESDSEIVTKPTPTAAAAAPSSTAGGKKPFQKVVDRARPGKILVNLPQSSGRNESNDADGPPAKRARITGRGGGAFSGFNSLLPPPKNTGKPATANSSSSSSSSNNISKGAPKPGVNLKTGAAPGFSREVDNDSGMNHENNDKGSPMNLPAPKAQQQPSIPAEQKAAEDVKLVGKPLMFKPLSVSRKPAKKNTAATAKSIPSVPKTSDPSQAPKPGAAVAIAEEQTKDSSPAPAPPKKVSLFSIPSSSDPEPSPSSSVYEPLFALPEHHLPSGSSASAFAAYDAQHAAPTPNASSTSSLDQIAAEMNLSAAARRELFGRANANSASAPDAKVISFDTSREYAHNEALRASGEPESHNPVRAIAPGKHSLRQLVNQVHNQRDALEESFAKGRSTQREAGQRYGWR
ncbi:mitotic checkpoint regulator, MAD2B-interacting-domain-containing protein [Camillea tinctor]|nr:mitotic checkpoint regulator, MAD2B-interacting-domain-containing protein [Camillea tinctor]